VQKSSHNLGGHLKLPGTSSKFRTEDQQYWASPCKVSRHGDLRSYVEGISYENAHWINLALDSVAKCCLEVEMHVRYP
jgi:alkylhydroperoxidase/carboxymuconolactone decarboxylase family protein YurZ